jgi:serine/threonine-protein kinase
MAFQPGQLAGDYEVLDVLGKGGMGHVYRVRNVISDRIEAMKVLLEDVGSQPGIEDRFIAEIRTLARLDHPNIAKLHTAFKVQNQLVMVMEFVEGIDLAERMKEGSIPVYKVVNYINQVLSALGYAHAQGVVHRDIKPSNIMITPQGSVKLMDFGIAKSASEPLLTQPGTTMGSLLYMSPEQVHGSPVDARSDLYSLGIVLYELTAGRRPFEGDSTYQVLDAQLNTPPPPPIEINPSLPKPLNDIILTALQKDPANRFRTAEAFRKALETVASPDPAAQTRIIPEAETVAPLAATKAQSGPPMQSAGAAAISPVVANNKPSGRRSLWMAAGAIACLCVLAAAVIVLPHFRKSAAASPSGASRQAVYQDPVTAGGSSPVPSSSSPSDSLTADTAAPTASKGNSGAIPEDFKGFASTSTRKTKAANTTRESAVVTPPVVSPAPQPPPAVPSRQTTDPAANQPQKPPPSPGPSDEQLNNASESLMKMQGRADAVTQSLATLRQQQAAQGLGMRGDIVASESRMNSYLQMAQRALAGRNLDLAQKSMESAEQELTRLEKFLGK